MRFSTCVFCVVGLLFIINIPPVHGVPFTRGSSQTDDLIIILALTYVYLKTIRKKRRPPKVWVNPYLKDRKIKGRYYKDLTDLRANPVQFRENFHVTPDQSDSLLALLKNHLCPKPKSRIVDIIPAEEKLCITLEFLASGTLQRHLASVYRISKQRIGWIIDATCQIIFDKLKTRHMPELNRQKWTEVSNQFHTRWNFPNCLGAIDGKHVAIKCPQNASSLYYNYKGFHSLVLMAVSDAQYKLLYIDIGAYGSEGDTSVFRKCTFGRSLSLGKLRLPGDLTVAGKSLPYMFLADDAFPLTERIMKPFKPTTKGTLLRKEERIFNYRLSRARRCVENSFGILCARWICLARTLIMHPERAQKVVAACCVLHNWLLDDTTQASYCPPGFADIENEDGTITPGNWREVIPGNSMFHSNLANQNTGRPTEKAKEIREHLKAYFSSDIGRLDWQDDKVCYAK